MTLSPVEYSRPAEKSIIVDKKAPIVTITTDKDYVSKDSDITYTFTWSEKVDGFNFDDISMSSIIEKGDISE